MEIRKCGAIKITKNTDIDKCASSGYETGFDRHGSFSFPGNKLGRNGVDMSSSKKIDNRKKDILILGKGPTQGLEHTRSAEKMYSINFTERNKKFCLSLHYNKENSYLFVNGTEIIKFKSKDLEVLPHLLCLGNISKDWSVDIIKKTGLRRYVSHFSVDYEGIAVDDILDIHKYLMKKNNMI